MADHMEARDIKSLDVLNYEDLRAGIRSGDLMFASGDYLVSKTIQQVTDSPWSHVGILLRFDRLDRVLLLESVEDMGVRLVPLSKYLVDYDNGKPYRGRVVLARCGGVSKGGIEELARFGIDELTRPYDREEIAAIVARIALGLGRRRQNRAYICSELVYECFDKAGKEFAYNRLGFISPEDIWRDDKVTMVGRLL